MIALKTITIIFIFLLTAIPINSNPITYITTQINFTDAFSEVNLGNISIATLDVNYNFNITVPSFKFNYTWITNTSLSIKLIFDLNVTWYNTGMSVIRGYFNFRINNRETLPLRQVGNQSIGTINIYFVDKGNDIYDNQERNEERNDSPVLVFMFFTFVIVCFLLVLWYLIWYLIRENLKRIKEFKESEKPGLEDYS